MKLRTAAVSGAIALAAAGIPLATPSGVAARTCGKPGVTVSHNQTSTTAHINSNPCSKWWIWPWGSFIDQDGNPDRDSVRGVKSGNPVVQESGARKNVLGGYGYSDSSGVITNVQTYG
jgi:hypothetical protein